MAVAFDEIGVSKVMIELRLRHNLDATNEQELISLRKIYSRSRTARRLAKIGLRCQRLRSRKEPSKTL